MEKFAETKIAVGRYVINKLRLEMQQGRAAMFVTKMKNLCLLARK